MVKYIIFFCILLLALVNAKNKFDLPKQTDTNPPLKSVSGFRSSQNQKHHLQLASVPEWRPNIYQPSLGKKIKRSSELVPNKNYEVSSQQGTNTGSISEEQLTEAENKSSDEGISILSIILTLLFLSFILACCCCLAVLLYCRKLCRSCFTSDNNPHEQDEYDGANDDENKDSNVPQRPEESHPILSYPNQCSNQASISSPDPATSKVSYPVLDDVP